MLIKKTNKDFAKEFSLKIRFYKILCKLKQQKEIDQQLSSNAKCRVRTLKQTVTDSIADIGRDSQGPSQATMDSSGKNGNPGNYG